MTASAGYARPVHPALRLSLVLTLSTVISVAFAVWTARYGVHGFATVCGGNDAARHPSAADMVGLLAGFVLIGAALTSLAVVWYVLAQRCDLRPLAIAYRVFAALWILGGLLLTGVAGKAIMTTLMANAGCT